MNNNESITYSSDIACDSEQRTHGSRAERIQYIHDVLEELLPNDKVKSVFDSKLRGQSVLLDNPVSSNATKRANDDATNASSLPRARLGRRKRKKYARNFALPKAAAVYASFEPMHQLWSQYVNDVIGDDVNMKTVGAKLLKIDFHGAILTVTRSCNPGMIGHTGIVVKETQHTFHICTKANTFKSLLKRGSWFQLTVVGAVHRYKVTLYGNNICMRPADRSARKFKASNLSIAVA